MVDRIRAAVDAKTDPDFVIMARTDALAVEGLDAAIERAEAYVEAGAEMLFPEAITELAMYSLPMRCRCRSLPTLLNLVPRRCLPPTNYAAPMSQWRCIPFLLSAP